MITFYQIFNKKRVRRKRKAKKRRSFLQGCPQRQGICTKVHIKTTRKPCSARRAMARVRLSNKKSVTCHIPGVRHNLKKFSSVLVRGGRPNDMPCTQYKIIRGGRKSEIVPLFSQRRGRSKVGAKNTARFGRTQVRQVRGDFKTQDEQIKIWNTPFRVRIRARIEENKKRKKEIEEKKKEIEERKERDRLYFLEIINDPVKIEAAYEEATRDFRAAERRQTAIYGDLKIYLSIDFAEKRAWDQHMFTKNLMFPIDPFDAAMLERLPSDDINEIDEEVNPFKK